MVLAGRQSIYVIVLNNTNPCWVSITLIGFKISHHHGQLSGSRNMSSTIQYASTPLGPRAVFQFTQVRLNVRGKVHTRICCVALPIMVNLFLVRLASLGALKSFQIEPVPRRHISCTPAMCFAKTCVTFLEG